MVTSIDEITKDWLSECVGNDAQQLRSYSISPLEHGGHQGSLHQIDLAWDGSDVDLPASVIAKAVHQSPDLHPEHPFNFAKREALVYQQGEGFTQAPVLEVYHARYDEDAGNGFLLLEHVTSFEHEDTRLMSEERLTKRAAAIGHMHAHWWQSEALTKPWLISFRPRANQKHSFPYDDNEAIEEYLSNWRSHLPATLLEAYDLMLQISNRAALLAEPFTLVHGDLHEKNCMFLPGGSIRFIDWNLAGIGHPGIDLEFCTLCIGDDAEARINVGLDAYRSALSAGGVVLEDEPFERIVLGGILHRLHRNALFRRGSTPQVVEQETGLDIRAILDQSGSIWADMGLLDFLGAHADGEPR